MYIIFLNVIFLKMNSKALFIKFTYIITYLLYFLVSELHRECDTFPTVLMLIYVK